jgi:uncharacterized protein YydD (DUF2326 family)
MKLSRIYANQPTYFPVIQFNGVTDDRLSVVFAKITKPKDRKKDSHNLGKTTLICNGPQKLDTKMAFS